MKARNKAQRRKIRTVHIPPKTEEGKRVVNLEAERQERERAAYTESVHRRMAQDGVDERTAKSQEQGHTVGKLARQLKWSREDAQRRIAASMRFCEIITAYRNDVLGAPDPNPPAMDMNRVQGISHEEISADRAKRLSDDFMSIHMALGAVGPASALLRLLDMACIENCDTDNWPANQIRDLTKALDAVAGC